jgi:hypothetical protein
LVKAVGGVTMNISQFDADYFRRSQNFSLTNPLDVFRTNSESSRIKSFGYGMYVVSEFAGCKFTAGEVDRSNEG